MSSIPNDPPTAMQALRTARALLAERGWTALREPGQKEWNVGPETGPLTLTQAIRRSALYGPDEERLIALQVWGPVTRMLVRTLWPETDDDLAFVALGEWSRAKGRTQDDVLQLFDVTIRRANRRLAKAIFEIGDGADE